MFATLLQIANTNHIPERKEHFRKLGRSAGKEFHGRGSAPARDDGKSAHAGLVGELGGLAVAGEKSEGSLL